MVDDYDDNDGRMIALGKRNTDLDRIVKKSLDFFFKGLFNIVR